ncbi:MAG: hypothetical protein K1X64_08260 [Myxococcaceae bacterium]|nr:hypothetical protein [Myxococcaceae bacterium]
MRFPPRLGHLATRSVMVAKLAPTYAASHEIDDEEAVTRLERAVHGALLEDLLAASWDALLGTTSRLDEEGLVEKVAQALKNRPQRPGRVAQTTAGWSAFLVRVDLDLGIASDAARRLLETDEGRKRSAAGLAEVGKFLAGELTRK